MKVIDKPDVWQWTGPADINDHVDEAHQGMDKLDYHVMVLTWKAVPAVPNGDGQASIAPARTDYIEHLQSRGFRRRPQPTNITTVRLHLLQGGWRRRQYPFGNHLVRKDDMENAEKTEERRRMQFLKAFADEEAMNLQEQWKAEDSLLTFEE